MHTTQRFRDADVVVDVVIHMVSVQEALNLDPICCIFKGVNTNELINNATDRR